MHWADIRRDAGQSRSGMPNPPLRGAKRPSPVAGCVPVSSSAGAPAPQRHRAHCVIPRGCAVRLAGMQPCCGRGEWQSGENNGIISFTFKILKSKLKDGGRMRLGIVAQDASSGGMDYALWFNPYNGYFSEAAYDVPEVTDHLADAYMQFAT